MLPPRKEKKPYKLEEGHLRQGRIIDVIASKGGGLRSGVSLTDVEFRRLSFFQ